MIPPLVSETKAKHSEMKAKHPANPLGQSHSLNPHCTAVYGILIKMNAIEPRSGS
jgi:hypothetical protein